ncbi:MAG: homoserine kinase, partial [Flavobacteriaceae bacterium]|nr:homoserine kinase [Flavobacteriaceae bacterium]
IAPCIFGGFTLVKGVKPLEILELPTPSHLFATIIHPQIEIKTSEARAILPKEIPLSNAIEQWANVGSLVHALHTSNYNLLSASLKDIIVEPYRKQLIPEFDTIKSKTLEAGALGVGISGSGPSIFALCNGETLADKVAETMYSVYQKSGIDFNIHISPINKQGIKVI